ncbi:hypothetical protein O6H91_06G057100 [Diphasiastrum complanatum]|nr:hypothetical protein O6H91_06G057100 [Diphasiastrum complanatum]
MRRGAAASAPAPIALSSRRLATKCSTGCSVLDSVLAGGIACGSITEIVGESASGKTQLALQLLLAVQMPLSCGGLRGSALYLFTEGYFPDRRLQQLARCFKVQGRFEETNAIDRHDRVFSSKDGKMKSGRKRPAEKEFTASVSPLGEQVRSLDHIRAVNNHSTVVVSNKEEKRKRCNAEVSYGGEQFPYSKQVFKVTDDEYSLRGREFSGAFSTSQMKNTNFITSDPCENIFVQGVQEVEELFDALDQLHALLVRPSAMPVRLIVIDSIAALFRSAFDNTIKDMSTRAGLFFKLASTLKRYAEQFDLAVVVTNQVMDVVEDQIKSVKKQLQIGNTAVLCSSGRMVAPALGLSWANCVNTRLFLVRWEQTVQSTETMDLNGSSVSNGFSEVNSLADRMAEEIKDCQPDLPLRLDEWLEAQKAHQTTSSLENPAKKMLQIDKGVVESLYVVGKNPLANGPLPSFSPLVSLHRKLQVVFAPHLPFGECEFVVEEGGIQGIPSSLE